MGEFTHFDDKGAAVMVDVGGKQPSTRIATAIGAIAMSAACYQAVKDGVVGKGDVLAVARLAGIMAVKRTPSLIPLCHGILIEKAEIDFTLQDQSNKIQVACTVKTTGVTGVEMEALTGATVALLTIYDMCKAIDKAMVLEEIYLAKKTGGKSGVYQAERMGGHD